jgi:hypothetical protein
LHHRLSFQKVIRVSPALTKAFITFLSYKVINERGGINNMVRKSSLKIGANQQK